MQSITALARLWVAEFFSQKGLVGMAFSICGRVEGTDGTYCVIHVFYPYMAGTTQARHHMFWNRRREVEGRIEENWQLCVSLLQRDEDDKKIGHGWIRRRPSGNI